MSITRYIAPRVPATSGQGAADALVLCAHGSRVTAEALDQRARALAVRGRFAAAAGCALKGEPDLERTLSGLAGRRIFLVPFLMSEGYSYDLLRRRLDAMESRPPVMLCAPVGTHPAMAEGVLSSAVSRAAALAWRPDECALLLVAHGTHRNQASKASLSLLRDAVAMLGGFAETGLALLEEEPFIDQALASLRSRRVIAVGIFAEAGQHGAEDIPGLLAASDRETSYLGPVGRESWIDEIVLSRAFEGDIPVRDEVMEAMI